MRSIRRPEEIGALTRTSASVVSLSASRVTVGPFQYVTTSALTISTAVVGPGGLDASVQAWKMYNVFAISVAGVLQLIASVNAAPTGYTSYRLIGYFDTNGSSQVVVAAKELRGAVGDHKASFLTEAQFQTENGPGWVLADNKTVAGSRLASLYGSANLPDLRGVVIRGKDHGASGKNPDGDLALGAYQADAFANHAHSNGSEYSTTSGVRYGNIFPGSQGMNIPNTGIAGGGTETRMKNVTANMFIKIN